jgi:hypothetical protein
MRDSTSANTKRLQAQPLQCARTTIVEIRKGADNARRFVNLTLGSAAATEGDVAAAEGRGVAGVVR